ncbi:MAG: outer membrane protein assembly factor BamE [Burkholderiales bacterium]|nr:outer membrane protein assembly factor BamE [Burkholderiales bacterium]
MKIILIITLLLAGCGKVPMLPILQPYKIEIQQGNYVTQDMVAKLKPGMTRSQVRFALGTPLIVDPFRTDRWDYVYMLHRQGNLVEQRQVTVVFKGDLLDRIEGDVVAGAAAPAGAKAAAPAIKPEPAQEKK